MFNKIAILLVILLAPTVSHAQWTVKEIGKNRFGTHDAYHVIVYSPGDPSFATLTMALKSLRTSNKLSSLKHVSLGSLTQEEKFQSEIMPILFPRGTKKKYGPSDRTLFKRFNAAARATPTILGLEQEMLAAGIRPCEQLSYEKIGLLSSIQKGKKDSLLSVVWIIPKDKCTLRP